MSSITPDLELPTLVVDDQHWQTVRVNNQTPLEYTISSRLGFRISTHGYEFKLPEDAGFTHPNVIQIVAGKNQLYATAYEKGRTLYPIDSANLVPLYGSRPFAGFTTGQKVIIAIGHLIPSSDEHPNPKITVVWAGVVNIV